VAGPLFWIVTANFTDDGAVAYRRANGTWSRALADAGLIDSETNAKEHAAASAQREQREVSDPYVIEVAVTDGVIHPQSARERIRANGPTIRIRRPD
jgi:sulfite reductase (NADPH) hemoprotein beta-component